MNAVCDSEFEVEQEIVLDEAMTSMLDDVEKKSASTTADATVSSSSTGPPKKRTSVKKSKSSSGSGEGAKKKSKDKKEKKVASNRGLAESSSEPPVSVTPENMNINRITFNTSKSGVYFNERIYVQFGGAGDSSFVEAPFGVSDIYPGSDPSAPRRQMQLCASSPTTIAALEKLDEHVKNAMKGMKGKLAYKSLLTTLDDGRVLFNTKINISDNVYSTKISKVVVGEDGVVTKSEGSWTDIQSDLKMHVLVEFWGVWTSNKSCGFYCNVLEATIGGPSPRSNAQRPTLKEDLGSLV